MKTENMSTRLTDSTMQLYTVYLKHKQLLKNHLASEPVYRRILTQIKNWTGCHISMLNIDPGLLFERWKLRPKSLNIPVVIINSSFFFYQSLIPFWAISKFQKEVQYTKGICRRLPFFALRSRLKKYYDNDFPPIVICDRWLIILYKSRILSSSFSGAIKKY